MRAADAPIHDDNKLPALTGVRFLAAASVLVSHFDHRSLITVPEALIEFLDGGRTAVSLFFVLSGFILAYNYATLSGTTDRARFYASRIARLYPVTLLALVIGAIGVLYAVLNRDDAVLLDWYALKEPNLLSLGGSFLGQLTMTTGWFPTASINQPWNGPAWSIACEMFFYALFPLLIVMMRRLALRWMAVLLPVGFASQGVIVWAARAFAPTGQKGFLVSQFPVTHLFEFVVGVAAGLIFRRGGRAWMAQGPRRNLLLAGSLVPLVALAYLRPVDPAYLLMSPFFAVLILALSVPPTRRPSWLAWGPLVLLGESSFSLYMIHVPLLNLYSIAEPSDLIGWVTLVATVAVSILVFKLFETPARFWVRRTILAHLPEPKTKLVGERPVTDSDVVH